MNNKKMKYLLTVIILLMGFNSNAQNFITLDEVSTRDIIPEGQAVFYGKFVQRLGFSSGGFPQDIRLINLDTNEINSFRVKPTFKSTNENIFIFIIKPGNYAILNYWWTKSQWYGGKTYTEPIFKEIDLAVTSVQNEDVRSSQFVFSIKENTVNYLGTWHFDKERVSFTNNKKELDDAIKSKYPNIDFTLANVIIPN